MLSMQTIFFVSFSRLLVKDQIKKEFGSGIITSLLLSLALKLAMKWIEQWMEDNLFGYNTPISVEDMKNDK